MASNLAFPRTVAATTALLLIGVFLMGCQTPSPAPGAAAAGPRVVQAHAVFTVAESKRLIARAVAQMPVVRKALSDGMVIVCRGTTNTYVAEELIGRRIPHGAFVLGHVLPEKGDKKLPKVDPLTEVILVKGQYQPELTMDEALKRVRPGDVIIKGGNALDYARKTVGVWTGSPTGGTTGKIKPYVGAGKAHLVIPIGLEKQVAGNVAETARQINEPADKLTELPRMQILDGQIVTELEAFKILAGVDAFQASAGGIGGAEGAAWIVWRGPPENVAKAREIAGSVHGEEPFIP
jgi:hypothetical protein